VKTMARVSKKFPQTAYVAMKNSLQMEWEKLYPTVRGFINARMSIALVRATNRCIRGSRIPASNMSNRFRWEEGAGLGLETLHAKQYSKIRVEFPLSSILTQVPNLSDIKNYTNRAR